MKTRVAVRLRGACAGVLCVAVGLMFTGCATPQMKGTPFYTGEYSVRRGPAEDRIAMWPLLYYREPALSVLWPIVEKTEDHFAVRPVMSIYGLDKDEQVYNVLWPIGQFDMQADDHRIFPFFWGDEYAVGFPLYWHFDDPFGGDKGYNALLPLWSYRKRQDGHSTHLMWPIFHLLERERRNGWRMWPLVGHYENSVETYNFLAWPLGHQWGRSIGDASRRSAGGSTLLPLYYHEYTPHSDLFVSLPYSRGRDAMSGEDFDLLFPLFFSQRERDERTFMTLMGGYHRRGDDLGWLAMPLLSGGRHSPRRSEVWAGGPLAHWKREGEERESHVFPLYYNKRTADSSRFVSLPWSRGETADGNSWELVPPLYYREKGDSGNTLITPLYAAGKRADGEREWDALLPFYFREKTPDRKLFASLLGGYETREDGRSWLIYPLLSGGHVEEDEGDLWLLAPLFHAAWRKEGNSHHILPLYYWNSVGRTFVSPLAARWGDENRRVTVLPPLLSLVETEPGRTDLWTAGGLAHLSWGERRGSQYVFPLFYEDPVAGSFLSPVWARWHSGGCDNTIIPPLLSGWSVDGDSTDVIAACGLFRNRSSNDPDERCGHLLPFYMYDGTNSLFTPIFGWDRDPHRGFYYPATPLVGIRTGSYSGGWLFPLYSHRRHIASGRVNGTFLWGHYWREDGRSRSGLFPLFSNRCYGARPKGELTEADIGTYGTRSSMLFLAHFKDTVTIWRKGRRSKESEDKVLLQSRTNKQRTVFPLFSYSRGEMPEMEYTDVDASVLLLLWDYNREIKQKEDRLNDYTRARLLWRVWHYERVNGDVSVDIFPFMTYDSKTDGFRKYSFMWRFFRYERGEEGRKLDLFFLPLVR